MTVKSLRKQLAAAIAMTLVATVALGSSTYAWFAINSKVTATGMNFTTHVSDNLFIAPSTHAKTGFEPDASNSNVFGTSLIQSVSGLLEPVSTIDGKKFFYSDVTNVQGNGAVKNPTWYNYGTYGLSAGTSGNKFNDNYQTSGAVGFVDYVYQLKAINGGTANVYLKLTQLDLFYNKAHVEGFNNSSFRAAVFVEDITGDGAIASQGNDAAVESTAIQNDKAVWLFSPNNAVNFSAGKAVNAVDGTDTVTYNNAGAIEVPNGTYYYKVVVRVWLEGEDTNCNNTTFAQLDDGAWSLDCAWSLEANNTGVVPYLGVSEIATLNIPAASTIGDKAFTIEGMDYYPLTGITTTASEQVYIAVTKDSTPATPLAQGTTKFYTIDTTAGTYPSEITTRVNVTTE